MRTLGRTARLVALTLTAISGSGCTLAAGIERGEPRGGDWCVDLSDCSVADPECRTAVACSEGQCQYEDAIEGTELEGQMEGDCARLVCDGAGKRRLAADESDVPDDGDRCTEDFCEGTKPHHEPREVLACYTGPAKTRGVGLCEPGIQYCDSSGKPLGECLGQTLPADEVCDTTVLDEDCDGKVNEEGKDCVCVPDAGIPCYTGPDGTENVGICHGGTASCLPSGLAYGACVGETLPMPESCNGAMTDQDCDGLTNEGGAGCCGDGNVSEGEACDDGNQSNLDACTKLCQPPVCGDGLVFYGETCDDGNTSDGDACPASCLRPIERLFAGGNHACALLQDGHLKCWGDNNGGQLGLGDKMFRGVQPGELGDALPAVVLGADKSIAAVSPGDDFTCALLGEGSLKCWGEGLWGQLGLEDFTLHGDDPGEMGEDLPVVDLGTGTTLAIAAGGGHSCALLKGGGIKCWGMAGSGQLGYGDKKQRGDDPGEMGDNLPFVDLGKGEKAVAVRPGRFPFTCAILESGKIKCWGANSHGQLGLGDTKKRGDEPGEMGDDLPTVDLGTGQKVVSLALGSSHACALLEGGKVKCWGQNEHGQLGLGDATDRGAGPDQMGDNLPYVDLGAGQSVVALAAGDSHTCALLEGGSVKCWGYNTYGQVGLGDKQNHGDSAGEMGDGLPAVDLGASQKATGIAVGGFFSCALLAGGRAKCWGDNTYGQLGLGDTAIRGDEKGEMGDQLPPVAP